MSKDALERLYNSSVQEESNYSLEEQMDSADSNEDDFLVGMSDAAETALFNKVTEITIDEPTNIQLEKSEKAVTIKHTDIVLKDIVDCDEDVMSDNLAILNAIREDEKAMPQEELFNNNIQETTKRKYKSRKQLEDTCSNSNDSSVSTYDPIMDQLAKDLIDVLRHNKYKINRFDDATMSIVFDYMYQKF